MSKDQRLKALEFFKDWTNYLLVTTVAALGWVSTSGALDLDQPWKAICVASFAISIVFAILTLAVIPIIAEQLADDGKSFYDVPARFRWFARDGKEQEVHVKSLCWPQHAAFLVGVLLYAFGTAG